MNTRWVLEAEQVGKRLGRVRVLNELDLFVGAGSVVCIEGPNGSGKSTLLRVLSGQLRPDRGSIKVCGALFGQSSGDGRSHLAYVPDHSEAFPELSAGEFIALVYALRRVQPKEEDAAREAQLGISDWSRRPMKVLSFGQRKRVCLAAALAGDPALLLLDEPTNGLDAAAIAVLLAAVQQRVERGLATVLTSHRCDAWDVLRPTLMALDGGRLRKKPMPPC